MEKSIKVLFVVSGNSKAFKIAPFVKVQGESLRQQGIDVEYFRVKGKGILGYLSNIPQLRAKIKNKSYDVIHAHYGLSSWIAQLSKNRIPLVISLMGNDVYGECDQNGKLILKSFYLIISSRLIQPFVSHIIVKSPNLAERIWCKSKSSIIPNGIDIINFKPIDKYYARTQLDIDKNSKVVLFLGNPDEPRKNFNLVNKSISILNDANIKLLNPFPVSHSKIPMYLNSADIFILTSFNEGSPNVIKEAMACNCPIVSTDVGDVRWVMGDTEGCYIISKKIQVKSKKLAQDLITETSDKIREAMEFAEKVGRTKGRERIIELGLDSETVANKIIDIYKRLLCDE